MAHLITSNDSVFLRQPAWHGLGIIGQVTKQTLIDSFGYPVLKEQLFTQYGEAVDTYATVRALADGSRIILGDKLSADYTVLQNSDLIHLVDPLLAAGCRIVNGMTLNQGRRVVILLELAGELIVGRDEHIKRFILISNDHTGKESARIGFTGVRVVCANTLNLAEQSKSSQLIRIRHEGDVLKYAKQVVKMIDGANGVFLAYGNTLDTLIDTPINQDDLDRFVKRVFFPTMDEKPLDNDSTEDEKEKARKDADRLLKLQNQINEIFQGSDTIVGTEMEDTAAGAYQAVNLHLNHLQNIGQERRLHNLNFGQGRILDLRALKEAELIPVRR